jgi:UDP-N-acetyl-D-glucosamine dehydrogenase
MNNAAQKLLDRFTTHTATICIVGQGYVGLPLALEFVEAGFRCIGLDIDEARVDELRRGESYITDVAPERLERALATGRFEATSDYARTADADAVCICVPTPLNKTRQPDLSYIQGALDRLCEHVQEPCLVVLESTTFPGTTEEVVAPQLLNRAEASRTKNQEPRTAADQLFIAFSPERVDPGNAHYTISNTPKVVGGVDEASTELVIALYEQIIDQVHPVKSATEAEMVKLLENTFRAVNIALVNEMAIMCDRMDIDIWEVIEAASTKPFGFMPFYPGPGIGGHCIPLDPSYLSWKAKTYGFHNRFIELATDVNTNMPRFVVDKLVRLLNEQGKAVKGAKVLLLGMAYKANVHDTRESPAIDIWRLLEGWGADLAYYDPYVDFVEELGGVRSVELTAKVVEEADAVVVVTDHDGVDYSMVGDVAGLVLDTRRVGGSLRNCVRL